MQMVAAAENRKFFSLGVDEEGWNSVVGMLAARRLCLMRTRLNRLKSIQAMREASAETLKGTAELMFVASLYDQVQVIRLQAEVDYF